MVLKLKSDDLVDNFVFWAQKKYPDATIIIKKRLKENKNKKTGSGA